MEKGTTALALDQTQDISKAKIAELSNQIFDQMEGGHIQGNRVLVYATYLAKLAADIRRTAMPFALDEISEKTGWMNADMAPTESGVKYDFTKCGHPEWNELNTRIAELTTAKKDIEKGLKAMTKPRDEMFDGGELTTVHPPIKTSTSIIKVEINR